MPTLDELNKKAAAQHERNMERYGNQPRAVLILETEDQVSKLRDAFLHRPPEQVERRIVNIMSLIYAIAGTTNVEPPPL